MNIDILEISELKWTGMGELNSDDYYSYYCGQESPRRNGVALIVNKRIQNAVLGCNLKNSRMISVCFQGKPFSITVIQVYASASNAKEAEIELFYKVVKNLPSMQETKEARVQSLGQEDPWRRAWQPIPVFLPGEFYGQRSLVGYSPQCCKESGITKAT